MKHIIPPIPKKAIKEELTEDRLIRMTNFGNNEIYIVNHYNAPQTLQEIGRLRELTFRNAGGGTGKDCDLDALDLAKEPYEQLIIWDSEAEEILGGYRFKFGNKIITNEPTPQIATAKLFDLSDDFVNNYLPYTIELGRSFVQPNYQSRGINRKTLFALDNLWDGIGALAVDNPDMKYFFGKVTMYPDYNKQARDTILYFMRKYFGNPKNLIKPKKPLSLESSEAQLAPLFEEKEYKEAYKILAKEVRSLGENIPPLINSYMNLSPSMMSFGTAINPNFGDVEETAILITAADIYPEKTARHINTYQPKKKG